MIAAVSTRYSPAAVGACLSLGEGRDGSSIAALLPSAWNSAGIVPHVTLCWECEAALEEDAGEGVDGHPTKLFKEKCHM